MSYLYHGLYLLYNFFVNKDDQNVHLMLSYMPMPDAVRPTTLQSEHCIALLYDTLHCTQYSEIYYVRKTHSAQYTVSFKAKHSI